MTSKQFIEACTARTVRAMVSSRTALDLFCEICGFPKSQVNYFIGDDPHGVVDIMEGSWFFNMSDIHVVLSEYERWLELYGNNKGIAKAVRKWYYFTLDQHEKQQHTEWISVEELLPERKTSRDSNGTKIINCDSIDVIGYDEKYKKCRLVCYDYESEIWVSHDVYTIGEISHWKLIVPPEDEVNRPHYCNLKSWLMGLRPNPNGILPQYKEEQAKRQAEAHERAEQAKQDLFKAIEDEYHTKMSY